MLALEGCIVTIDAMGCQTEIAKLIIAQDADYVLSLKGNQGTLHQDVKDLFAHAFETQFQDIKHDFHQTLDNGHGRQEIRRCWTISDPDFLTFINPKHKWAGLQSIGLVEAERHLADTVTKESRFSSLRLMVKLLNSPLPLDIIGTLKIGSIGFWILLFVKMTLLFVRASALKIWPSYATLPLTSFVKTGLNNVVSRISASLLAGITISSFIFLTCHNPCFCPG